MDEYIDYYLKLGFCLIPAYPKSKRPCVEWKKYQIEKPLNEEIEEWKKIFWSNGYNIGCLAGRVSDNLVVLDIDSETLVKNFSVEKFKKKTMVVLTGSGCYHIYFRCDQPIKTVKFLDSSKRTIVEIRGEGSFNVLPPSIHPETGKQYTLLSKPDDIVTIEEPVESLTRILGVQPVFEDTITKTGFHIRNIGYEPPCIKTLFNPETKVHEGWRNEALIRVASYLYSTGVDESDLKFKTYLWNIAHCIPPLDSREVVNVVKSVLKHGYTYGCRGLSQLCTDDMRLKCKIYKNYIKNLEEKMEEIKIEAE